MKRRVIIKALSLALCAALAAALLSGCDMFFVPDIDLESYLNTVMSDDPDTSGMPVIVWNEDDPDSSQKELFGYLSKCEEKIAVSGHEEFSWEDICYYAFWVKEFTVTRAEGKSLRVYEFTYLDDAKDNHAQWALVESEVKDIISAIPDSADDWDKILAVHDELVKRVTYCEDESASHRYDVYGALVDHKAVCQGYTYAMRNILDRLDIDSECISSETHIWNRINDIGGNEKYIDITWDDTDEYDKYGQPYVFHNCFMITGAEMERLEDHYAERTLPDDGEKTGGNYFRHRGGIIPKGKNDIVSEEISRQIGTGTNLVEMRFVSKDDYKDVVDKIDDYMDGTDYTEAYMLWTDDELRIVSLGLHPGDED